MKKDTLTELIDWLYNMPINLDNLFLSPLSNKTGKCEEFTALNGVREIIMILLLREKKLTMSQLANYIGSSNQRMTFPVNRLVESWLVDRTRDPDDNRIFVIQASEKGRSLTDDYLKNTYETLGNHLGEKFTDEDFAEFTRLLEINLSYMKEFADNINNDYGKNS